MGGVPKGRVIEIYGPESSGKTTLALTIIANSQKNGGNAVFINHEASRTSNDCYVLEIPPGKSLAPARHLFEEMIFILDGRGSTTVWNDAGQRVTFEWKAGALFGIPMNCWHRHFNGSGQVGARYVAVTNAPPVINLYEDTDFVFNTTFDFKQRFNGEQPVVTVDFDLELFRSTTDRLAGPSGAILAGYFVKLP